MSVPISQMYLDWFTKIPMLRILALADNAFGQIVADKVPSTHRIYIGTLRSKSVSVV